MATTPAGELVATGIDMSWWAHARDSGGIPVWTTNLGPAPAAGPRLPITVDSDGNVIVASMTQNDPTGRGYLATLTSEGILVSMRALSMPVTGLATVGEDVALRECVDGAQIVALQP